MTSYRDLIVDAATPLGLSPNLVEAVVLQESSGDPWAWNPEPRYRYLWNVQTRAPFRVLTEAERGSETPPADFPSLAGDRDQEWWAQQASWGLMQVMGALARERGFAYPFLTELCGPAVNLGIGCAQLATLLAWAKGDVRQALAAYNAGEGNYTSAAGQQYASQVLALLRSVNAASPEAAL